MEIPPEAAMKIGDRIRKCVCRGTLVLPIVLFLLSIGSGMLISGYYIDRSVILDVFEEREPGGDRDIRRTLPSPPATGEKRILATDPGLLRKLLAKNRTRRIVWGLFLLPGLAIVGVVLTRRLVLPLARLRDRSLDAIREFSAAQPGSLPPGNELAALSRAHDILLGTIRDHLAERTRAEDELRETSRTLHALIEASPPAVIVTDGAGTVRLWNPAAARMFGWSEAETRGNPNPLLVREGNGELRATCTLVLQGEKFTNTEICARTRDGSEIILLFSGAPLRDDRGEIHSIMAIMTDISEAKKAESALNRSEARLRQTMKMEAVGKLAGGVAHDFNNLLSVITGYSELLIRNMDPRNPMMRDIEEIRKAGVRAAALTHQLLAFSRRQVLKPKLLSMNDAVETLGRMLRRLIREDIAFSTRMEADLWTVRADPSQIDQILMNLCVNARDAMPDGGKLVVSTENVDLKSPLVERELTIPTGRYAALHVADTGSGMETETLGRIFEPFFTTKDQGKGTGLGLATVYGIVKQSEGFIRVRSEPGSGSIFSVYLPAVPESAPETAEDRPDPPRKDAAGDLTILLAEDEDMVRDLAVEIFRGSGYAVLDAPNGIAAMEISDRHPGRIDLLVTDLVMPGMNGIELARRIGGARPGTPVLFMSGYAEHAMEQMGYLDEERSFLQKPITPTNLSRKVREILSDREVSTA